LLSLPITAPAAYRPHCTYDALPDRPRVVSHYDSTTLTPAQRQKCAACTALGGSRHLNSPLRSVDVPRLNTAGLGCLLRGFRRSGTADQTCPPPSPAPSDLPGPAAQMRRAHQQHMHHRLLTITFTNAGDAWCGFAGLPCARSSAAFRGSAYSLWGFAAKLTANRKAGSCSPVAAHASLAAPSPCASLMRCSAAPMTGAALSLSMSPGSAPSAAGEHLEISQ
jgi:hypothetical protein